eukprot:scaffold49_cov409-Prasinococcus_capsulatus_cf.AAC.12
MSARGRILAGDMTIRLPSPEYPSSFHFALASGHRGSLMLSGVGQGSPSHGDEVCTGTHAICVICCQKRSRVCCSARCSSLAPPNSVDVIARNPKARPLDLLGTPDSSRTPRIQVHTQDTNVNSTAVPNHFRASIAKNVSRACPLCLAMSGSDDPSFATCLALSKTTSVVTMFFKPRGWSKLSISSPQ